MNITLFQKYPSRILIRIETDNICLEIEASCVFDPFEELYVWLGMIRDHQLPAKMAIDEEGYGVTLNAKPNENGEIDFTIKKWIYDEKQAPIYLQRSIKAKDLIQLFYDGINDFIKERYIASASSFIILSNINWDNLLKKPDRVPDWKMGLAMYGGGKGQYLETGIDTVETTLYQKELYYLRHDLYRLNKYDKTGVLTNLYKKIVVDIALDEIDSDWYEKRRKEIYSEDEIYFNSRIGQEERERLFELRKARLKTLKLGQLVDGIVAAFKPYGLFINIAGVNALLHISMVSQLPVEDLTKIFQLRGWVRARVNYLDIEKGRVGRSTKELESQPGDMLKDPILVYQNAEAMAEKY